MAGILKQSRTVYSEQYYGGQFVSKGWLSNSIKV